MIMPKPTLGTTNPDSWYPSLHPKDKCPSLVKSGAKGKIVENVGDEDQEKKAPFLFDYDYWDNHNVPIFPQKSIAKAKNRKNKDEDGTPPKKRDKGEVQKCITLLKIIDLEELNV